MVKRLLNLRKTAALLIATFAITIGVNAQSWYLRGEYKFSPPHPQGIFQVLYYQAEDTEINGLVYHTIYIQGQGVLVGAYRNEDNQVYYCKWNGSSYAEEEMLYDYDLEVGDYFNDFDEHPMRVSEVSTFTDHNGVERKKISFYFMGLPNETEYWIEGIGSSRGFVYVGQYEPVPGGDGDIYQLLCYHEDDDVLFVNPEFNTCDIDEIEENSGDNGVSIYPNPANDVIKILNDNGLNISNVEIIDLTGRTVMSSANSTEVNISELPEGQYFVRITGESTIVKKLSVSK